MKKFQSKIRAAATILPVIIVLAAATLAGVAALKISYDSYKTSVVESKNELIKAKTLDRLSVAAAVLVDMINRVVAIKSGEIPSDAVSGAFSQALMRTGTTLSEFDSAVEAMSIDDLPSLNSGGMFEIFAADDQIEYLIDCRTNCTASTQHYPKTFYVQVTDISESAVGSATTASVTAEVRQASLNEYSSMTFRETEPEILLGAGQHAKIGIFWDTEIVDPGTIRFVHTDGVFSANKMITNTSTANIEFFTMTGGGHHGQTMVDAGEVSIPGGVLGSATPDVEIASSVSDLIPSAFQGGNEDVQSCRVIMGCDSGNCTIEIEETLADNSVVTAVAKRTPSDDDVYYSPSPSGCRVEADPSNDGTNEIYTGTANMTIITPQGFDLSMSITPDPDLNDAAVGNILFASQYADAVRLQADTLLLSGKTIQETHASSAGTYPDGVGFRLHAGALTTDSMPREDEDGDGKGDFVQPARAIGYDNGAMDPPPSGVIRPSWGILETSGPKFGGGTYITKLVQSDGDRAVGFEEHKATYPSRWIYQGAPGLQASTISDHVISFGAIIMDQGESLINALATVGLDYDDSATAPDIIDNGAGGDTAPSGGGGTGYGGYGGGYSHTFDGSGDDMSSHTDPRDTVLDISDMMGGPR